MATIQRGATATSGRIYWANFQRIPNCPIVSGSHYGTRVDCAAECDGLHGHVFTTAAAAAARLAILPTHYLASGGGQGAPIVRETGRVLYSYNGGAARYYDVTPTAADALAAGDWVNTAGDGASAPHWQQIQTIDHFSRVGGRPGSGHGADVYSVVWSDSELLAAPSLLSSRQSYDVVTLRY
jgi:hypothetical protein